MVGLRVALINSDTPANARRQLGENAALFSDFDCFAALSARPVTGLTLAERRAQSFYCAASPPTFFPRIVDGGKPPEAQCASPVAPCGAAFMRLQNLVPPAAAYACALHVQNNHISTTADASATIDDTARRTTEPEVTCR
jgi:hypothetical protein